MIPYRYRAISASGQAAEGEIMAGSRQEAIDRILALGHIPVFAEEAGVASSSLKALLTRDIQLFRRNDQAAVAGFIRQLGILLRAGLPLDQTLEVMDEVSRDKTLQGVPRRLLERIRGGTMLADAMANEVIFPRYCVSMVQAGEISGALEAVLDRLAGFLERSQAARARVKSALAYPIIVLVVCLVTLFVLFTFVVPRFRPFFEDAQVELPLTTQLLLSVADAASAFWWLPVGLAIVVALGAKLLLQQPDWRRRRDGLLLRLPLVGEMIHKSEIAHFSRILGTLLKNGVALPAGLRIASETIRNQALAHAFSHIARIVTEGKGLSEPLAQSRVVPALALRLVRVGEEAGRLDDMLLEVASIFDMETQQGIDRLLTLLGPALTIGLGLLVAFIIGSLMMAIMSVYQFAA